MSVVQHVQKLSQFGQKSSAPVQNAVQQAEIAGAPVASAAATQMQTRAAYGGLASIQRKDLNDHRTDDLD